MDALIQTGGEVERRDAAGVDAQAVKDRIGSRSRNTKRNYESRLYDFSKWRGSRPVSDSTIRDYLHELAGRINPGTGRPVKFSTITAAASAIRSDLRAFGQAALFGPRSQAALAAIRRDRADSGLSAPTSVDGLSWDQIARICAVAEATNTVAGLRDSALIRLMSDGLLRISEAVGIDAGHLKTNEANGGSATLHIPRSKTDQDGKGATAYIGPETMAAVDRWRAEAGIDDGPVFIRVRRGGHVQAGARMTVDGARLAIKARARQAGLKARVSGHSMRIGSCENLVRLGASSPEVEQAGRWTPGSGMVTHYARHELAGRGAIARFKYGRQK